jgi:hypothetical protein
MCKLPIVRKLSSFSLGVIINERRDEKHSTQVISLSPIRVDGDQRAYSSLNWRQIHRLAHLVEHEYLQTQETEISEADRPLSEEGKKTFLQSQFRFQSYFVYHKIPVLFHVQK